MKIERPEGANRCCGIEQGWQGLPIRDDDLDIQLQDQPAMKVNRMVTRWSPTEEERLRLLAGEDVFVAILGNTPAPMMVGVGDPKTYGW